MIQIKDTIISNDVLDKNFCCDLKKCKGICCIKGDAGAPLNQEEVDLLPTIINNIKSFLRPEGVKAIEEQGTHVLDEENETVTPLVNGEECAYVVFEDGIAFCGIEKAYNADKIKFRKPISCHLYPIRIRKYEQFIAVNYDIWDVCNAARKKGEKLQLPVFQFVKEALVRRFGEDWYRQLSVIKQKAENSEE